MASARQALATLSFLLLVALSGCAIHLKKDASVGLRFGSEISLYHSAPDDGAEAKLTPTPWLQQAIDKELERRAQEDCPDVLDTDSTE